MSALKLYKKALLLHTKNNLKEASLIYNRVIREYPNSIYAQQSLTDIADIHNRNLFIGKNKKIYSANISSNKSLVAIAVTPIIGIFATYFIAIVTIIFTIPVLIMAWKFYLYYIPAFILFFWFIIHKRKITLIKTFSVSFLACVMASLLIPINIKAAVYFLFVFEIIQFKQYMMNYFSSASFLFVLAVTPALIGGFILYYWIREIDYKEEKLIR